MTQNELPDAKDQDLISSLVAMRRAAVLARKIAIETGTDIVISVNGVITRRTAAELIETDKRRQVSLLDEREL